MHPALGEELAHPGVDDRVPGVPGPPRLDGVLGLVVAHPRHLGPQVGPRRARLVEQDVGVELAPGELGLVRVGPLAPLPREVGEQRARVQDTELEVRRHPRGAVAVGAVAVVGVAVEGPLAPRAPPREGRLLPGRGSSGRSGAANAASRAAVASASLRAWRRGSVRGVGAGSGHPWARHALENGVKTLYGSPDPLTTRPGPHRVRRPRLDPLDPVLPQPLRDLLVAAAPRRSRLAGHVDRGRADPLGERRHDPARVAVEQGEVAVERLVERAQVRGEPRRAGRAASVPQPRVDDEGDDEVALTGGVARREEGGVVAATQVAAEPEDGGHRGHLTRAGRGRAAGGRASPATR